LRILFVRLLKEFGQLQLLMLAAQLLKFFPSAGLAQAGLLCAGFTCLNQPLTL